MDNGATWTAIGTVSSSSALLLNDDANTRLYFAPVADFSGIAPAALTIRAWDRTTGVAGTKVNVGATGGATAFSSATDVIDVTVTGINDAPILSGSNAFSTITEDEVANNGTLVSALKSGHVLDVDAGTLFGIVITAIDSSDGLWQYTIDSGASWNDVGEVSATSSLLLASTDRVRFIPNGISADTARIVFRAWDQTSGTAGTKVDS